MAARMPGKYEVVGAAVVLKTDTTERYLYKGTQITTSEFDKDSIAHAVKAGLLAPVKAKTEPTADKPAADEAAGSDGEAAKADK